ncbi:MAG: efflux RND transporter permease subunit [Bacteroidaceae bacterium]|nr:efflux RND transporter permease subunit [Bacteroidaceae bacterium]
MNKSVRTSSFTLIVSFLCAALVGAALLPLLPVRLYPSRVNPSLTVSFSLPNSSARVVEMEVTSKLEAMLARMKGVRSISSRSYNGSGSISVSLDKHANIEAIRFEAATIVRQAWPELPDGTSYPQVRVNSPGDNAQRPFLTYTLNASAPPALIQQYAEEHIQPALARIKGVYQVSVSGAMPMEWQLEYDPHQLVTLGLTPGDIQNAVSGHFRTEHLGKVSVDKIQVDKGRVDKLTRTMRHYSSSTRQLVNSSTSAVPLIVRSSSTDATGFPIDEILVRNRDGRLIRLDELVTVRHTEAPPQSYYRINGLNSIYLSVTAEETANQLALGEKVRMVMDALETDMPRGYEVYMSYDATQQIEEELEKIYFRSGLTVLILLLFVLLLTRRWRYMVLVTASLAVNLLVAVVAYYLLGIEIQLYTLAGITISLNLIIDNTIVMADHLLRRHNLNAYLSILTATLTTISALGVVLFLNENLRATLGDFSVVIVINLAVSLLIALFFVPSLMDKLGMMKAASDELRVTSDETVQEEADANRRGEPMCSPENAEQITLGQTHRSAPTAGNKESSSTCQLVNLSTKKQSSSLRSKRLTVVFTRIYGQIIRFVCRHRVIVCTVLVLVFGLPVFLIPEKMEDDEGWHGWYNQTLGSDFYKEKVRPIVNTALGGTWRLFVEKVYNGSYFNDEHETVLHVTATLPNGSTLEQMNTLVKRMEGYLVDKIQVDKLTRPSGTDSWSTHQLVNSSTETSISQFQTRISSPYQASIDIYFPKEHQHGSFPYQLKADLTARALELGGGSWSIYGLEDQGFNNSVQESAGSYRVRLTGYNYDELYLYAEALRDSLLTHRRVKEVIINSSFTWYKEDYRELHFDLREGRLAETNLTPTELYGAMRNVFARDLSCGTVRSANGGYENVRLTSSKAQAYDSWQLQQLALRSGDKEFKLHSLADIGFYQQAPEVVKNNQEYTLCLQYEYIGAYQMGEKMLNRVLESFNKSLPPGYKARSEMGGGRWSNEDNSQYLLLLLVAAVIFVVTSILFNSLRRPFAILFVIPISYIGVFLTFWLFELNFDQGGFAAFILLCGITVNAGIYLLDEYADIRKARPALSPVRAYLKAWNAKIVPILLTILSTILGFIPFMVGTGKEAFWFPLAAGTVGGLIMSFVGIFLYLPLFCLPKSHE